VERNRIQTTDSLFFKKEMFESAKSGFQHSIPISTNFKLFKYLSFSTSANYKENWTFNTISKSFDNETSEVLTQEIKGFDSFRTYNFSSSLGTTVYGMYDFGKEKKVQAIRHVMRPSVSYSINPAFNDYYETYEVVNADGLTSTELEYTRFEGSIFGSPNNNFSSSIGLSVSNNLEAKVTDSDSTNTESKKVVILNNLNFSTSYNMASDSLNWSPVRLSGGTQLFDNKMSVNFGATLDPYALDENNNKINEFNINSGGNLFRLTSANLTFNYSLSNKGDKNKSKSNSRSINESLRSGGRDDDLFGQSMDFADSSFLDDEDEKEEEIPSELFNYTIPWSLRVAYAVNYNNSRNQKEISSHSIMFSGRFRHITKMERWSIIWI
jgi:hypothetical protein